MPPTVAVTVKARESFRVCVIGDGDGHRRRPFGVAPRDGEWLHSHIVMRIALRRIRVIESPHLAAHAGHHHSYQYRPQN